MSYALLFLAALAAGLTWTAALVAAAARVQASFGRRLLVAAGVVLPLAAWLPWLSITAVLAFGIAGPKLETNWFPQVGTVTLATVIGSVWIAVAGLRRDQLTGEPGARSWPLGRLALGFVASKLAAACMLLAFDHDLATQADSLRVEVADLVTVNLPPQVSDAENAAPLYLQAFAILESDADLAAIEQLASDNEPGLLENPVVTAAITRHTATLALLEQAAARDVCRFTRDWTRPSFAMLLPEIQTLRRAARLVSLAARHDAANGDTTAALKKIETLGSFARHAAGEPLIITTLVSFALDAIANETLADVLPALTADDDELLADLNLPMNASAMIRAFYGEEAFGLTAYADIMSGEGDTLEMLREDLLGVSVSPRVLGKHSPFGSLFRVFLIPADLAGYRSFLHRFQRLAGSQPSYAQIRTMSDDMQTELVETPPGVLSALLLPAMQSALEASLRDQARHACLTVLVAATRQRLATGTLPSSLEEIDPQWLPLPPRDPFTGTTLTDRAPLRYQLDAERLSVYSVGPDGADDGGPAARQNAPPTWANDDTGASCRTLTTPNTR